MKSWRRAHKLAASVQQWYPDGKVPGREVGWVEQLQAFVQPTRQLALRTRKKNGQWAYHVLVFRLSDTMLFELLEPMRPAPRPAPAVLWAALYAYDQRGGGLETQNRGDKQGLGLTHRNKHRFSAQEMLVLLAQLAHNLVIWTRNDLARVDSRFEKYGIQRTVRDALQIAGHVQFNPLGQIEQITLNQHHPLTATFQQAFTLCK